MVEAEDLTVLVTQNQDLMDFVKKIQLDLFERTGEEKYLDNLLEEGGELDDYHRLSAEWQALLEMLKVDYPAYYQMRYAQINSQLMEFPKGIQIVRFFFVEDKLKAVVIADGKRKRYPLDFDQNLITSVQKN